MNSFLPPLTAAEERYYLQKYTEGDLEAKHILIERNLRLVAHVIKKYQNLDEDPEWEMTKISDEQTYFDLEYVFTIYERR